MAVDANTAIARGRDSAFAGLLCATLGLVLVESANVLAKGNVKAHGISLLLGAAIISLMLSAFMKRLPQLSHADGTALPRKSAAKLNMASGAACAVIAWTGYVTSSMFMDSLVTPLFLFVGGLVITPWRRVARSRAQYIACWAAVIAGVGGALFFHGREALPFFLAGFGFYLWLIALACWMVASFHKYSVRKVTGKR